MSSSEICFKTATELVRLVRDRELSAREVMEAHLAQIDRVNPAVNAIVTLLPERALKQADAADEALARGEDVGPLHGLPIAHKDLVPTKGIRTTSGSPIFKDFVPDRDGLIVERLRKAGAITMGKTNVPEFGAGSQTYNEVFGETLNPYDTSRTCGGSSGGAAVALACGMQPIADGSDMGGSLRNPQLLQCRGVPHFAGQGAGLAPAFRLVSPFGARAYGPHGAGHGAHVKRDRRARRAFSHRHR